MNLFALTAVVILAGALIAVFGSLYLGAARSHRRGELGAEGLRILRWALVGQIALYVLLAMTTFMT